MPDTTPFSQSYVINVTIEHMKRDIDHSIRKTLGRMEEFQNDPEKTYEIMVTLASLNRLHDLLDSIVQNNSTILENTQ